MKRQPAWIFTTLALVWLLAGLPLRAFPIHAAAPAAAPDRAQGGQNALGEALSPMITEIKKLAASQGIEQDESGLSVAVGGDTIAVGAPQENCGVIHPCLSGRVDIFTRSQTGQWVEQPPIVPYDVPPPRPYLSYYFGWSVAISGDILVVGAPEAEPVGGSGLGAVYIYQRRPDTPGAWDIMTKLIAPTGDYDFGWSVAISGDTLVVGAPNNYTAGKGAILIYERDQGGTDSWGLVKRWGEPNTFAVDHFGRSVAVDGDSIIAENDTEVLAFDRNQGGPGAWGQKQKISVSGYKVSLSIQGNTLVIGDWAKAGAAYIFERDPASGLWGLAKTLTVSDGGAVEFGSGVSLDGDTIVVGAEIAPVDGKVQQGAAYLFCRNKGGPNAWGEAGKLIASDGAAYDWFGYSVATQGGQVVVGSPGANVDGKVAQGAAYVYAGCKQPLVFIHGAAGSRMVDNSYFGVELWPGFASTDLYKLSLFSADNPSPSIVPFEPIARIGGSEEDIIYQRILEALKKEGGYREYLVGGDLTLQTEAGCDYDIQKLFNPDLFVFTYDWRKSIDDNAGKLKEYIACVQKFFPYSKVNILAHSMGGVIARRYILDNPGASNVNALVTVGSPFIGAPKMPFVLETGEFYDSMAANIVRGTATRYITGSFKSAFQLSPSRAWYDLGGESPVIESGYDLNGDKVTDQEYDYTQLTQMLNDRYGCAKRSGACTKDDTHEFQPGTENQTFHNKAGQDDWSGDTTGILYHHIYGEQNEIRTIGQIFFTVDTACFEKPNWQWACKHYPPRATPIYTIGDKTVPVLSATRIGNGKNYNAPNARLYMITNPDDELASHVGMLRNPEVITLILDILKDPTYTPAPGAYAAQTASNSYQPAQYLAISGGDSVIVRDAFGNDTSPIPGNEVWRNSVPGVDLYTLDNRTTQAVLPVGQAFTVTFTTLGDPFSVDLRTGTGKPTTQIIRYRDIDQPAGIPAQLVVTAQNTATLKVDRDRNGSFETEIAPSIERSGTTELDMDPPEVTIRVTENRGKAAVTISASDAGTGVKTLLYSLDGTNFSPYTAPFELQGCQYPVIYAFAEDQMLNRSSLVTKNRQCGWLYLPVIHR